ncbi:hypothetical protein KIPB_014409, partial [Kipferlia bialata]
PLCQANIIYLSRAFHFIFHLTSKTARKATPSLYVVAVIYVILAIYEITSQIYTSFFAVKTASTETGVLAIWQVLILNRIWVVGCEFYFMSKVVFHPEFLLTGRFVSGAQ